MSSRGFFQKTNEWIILTSMRRVFVRFLEESSARKNLSRLSDLYLVVKSKWEKIFHYGKCHFISGYLISLTSKFWHTYTNLSLSTLSWILYVDFTVRWPPEMCAAADFRRRDQSYRYKVLKALKKIWVFRKGDKLQKV